MSGDASQDSSRTFLFRFRRLSDRLFYRYSGRLGNGLEYPEVRAGLAQISEIGRPMVNHGTHLAQVRSPADRRLRRKLARMAGLAGARYRFTGGAKLFPFGCLHRLLLLHLGSGQGQQQGFHPCPSQAKSGVSRSTAGKSRLEACRRPAASKCVCWIVVVPDRSIAGARMSLGGAQALAPVAQARIHRLSHVGRRSGGACDARKTRWKHCMVVRPAVARVNPSRPEDVALRVSGCCIGTISCVSATEAG